MKRLICMLFTLALVGAASAQEWHIETVDYLGSSGTDTSLELDTDDLPFIAYYKDKQLVLARKEGEGWNIEVVDDEGPFLFYVSLVLDSQNLPHIAYFEQWPVVDLKYAHWTGTEWLIETVDSEGYVGAYCSIAVDSSDRPCIAYFDGHDGDSSDLKYARWDGDEWQFEHVDTGGDTCYYISLVLDSNDHPHISYMDYEGEEDLRYAHWDGSEWWVETVDAEDITGYYSSIALDSRDRPHISYRYNSEALDTVHLRYAHWDGSQWRIETVDSDGLAGGYTSIALDSADRPCISYYEYRYETTRYARWDGKLWLIYDLDPHACGDHTSMEVDSFDQPHISYTGFGTGSSSRFYGLKYAWYEVFFHLLIPERGEIVTTLTPTLDWTDDDNPDLTGYTLWWGTDPDFDTYNEVAGIGESEYTITGGIEDEDRIYWRVKSVDSEGGEHWAEELDWHFTVYVNFNPIYHLLSPEKGEVVDTTTPALDWQDQKIPNLESYTLWWGTDWGFDTYNEVTGIAESEYQIAEGIEDGDCIYWQVKSIDDEGGEYWAEEMDWYFYVDLGGGIDIVDFAANSEDEAVLVNWRIEGDSPSGLRVLRTIGDEEPIFLHSEPLNGDATKYLDREVETGVEYRYWLEVTEADGTVKRFGPTEAVSIPEQTTRLALGEPYPSPARDAVTLTYDLPNGCSGAVIEVYDLAGRRLDSIPLTDSGEITLEVSDYASGVYTARLSTEEGSVSRRLVITR